MTSKIRFLEDGEDDRKIHGGPLTTIELRPMRIKIPKQHQATSRGRASQLSEMHLNLFPKGFFLALRIDRRRESQSVSHNSAPSRPRLKPTGTGQAQTVDPQGRSTSRGGKTEL